MTAEEYAEQFKGIPSYYKVVIAAFKAGQKNAKSENFQKLEKKLKEAQKELRDLRNMLDDPEKIGEYLAGS